MQEFYAYRLAIRGGFSPIHSGGKLFQQYIVDAYVKVEGCRLKFIAENQAQLRVAMYSGLMDHLARNNENEDPRVPVILPSSFTGSPRNMQQCYQDAMAIVCKYGRPDLFITYTCNPKCREVTENLQPHETAQNRPDLLARVFKQHLNELMIDIKDRHVLGVPIAAIHVIEFQKRGLPHCHMLIMLLEEDKIRSKEQIDNIVSAELLSEHDPELRELVKKLMIHGPCGTFNPNSICMVEGECQKKFPMPYQEETITNVSGYPLYRRRNNGDSVRVGVHEVDCSFVVPYNKYLLRKYGAHINVEVCISVKNTYLRLKHFGVCQNIKCMDSRTQFTDWHSICLTSNKFIITRAEGQDTQLTAWFKLNQSDVDARAHLYTDTPEYYVFDNQSNTWTRRQRHRQIVTRMYSASPRNAEKFHLRMLLFHVPGATSFDDLKTIGGEQLPTFKDACIRLQLLEDDNELEMALSEAAIYQMPRQLFNMFAIICLFNTPQNALQLWNDNKHLIIEDLLCQYDDNVAENIALHHINMILNENGMNCAMLGLPEPISEPPAIQHMEEIQEVNPEVLNIEQRYVFNSVINAVSEIDRGLETNHRLFYLDAPGGSGKTFLFNMIHDYLVAQNVAVSTSAWTGIAATLLKNGKTLHSIFKLPVPLTAIFRLILTKPIFSVNEDILRRLPTESKTYLSIDSVSSDNEMEANNYPIEFINSLTPSGMPPHRLNLKVGSIIMLLRNLSITQGLCNGTRLEVLELHNHSILASIMSGSHAQERVLIPRIKFNPSDDEGQGSSHSQGKQAAPQAIHPRRRRGGEARAKGVEPTLGLPYSYNLSCHIYSRPTGVPVISAANSTLILEYPERMKKRHSQAHLIVEINPRSSSSEGKRHFESHKSQRVTAVNAYGL
ncbi:uncharacterized protein LOC143032200 [Oratosquilla oratoria]|uniref:uncharacterized protein LOC143032200 n=1 Tax=Oratosquilla oratoria TaxID=337810 RepID=UPI003F765EC9